MPGTIVGAEDFKVDRRVKAFVHKELTFEWGEADTKQTKQANKETSMGCYVED